MLGFLWSLGPGPNDCELHLSGGFRRWVEYRLRISALLLKHLSGSLRGTGARYVILHVGVALSVEVRIRSLLDMQIRLKLKVNTRC